MLETGVNLATGNHIKVTDTATSTVKELTVAPLTFDVLNPFTDTASGTASPNATVDLEIFEDANQFNGQTKANGTSGAWSISLAPFDVKRGGGTAMVFDGDGDSTNANRGVPTFSASTASDVIRSSDPGPPWTLDGHFGGNFTANSSVTVQILSSPAGSCPGPSCRFSGSVATKALGAFEIRKNTHKVDLIPGMEVRVTDATTGITKRLTLSSVTFDVLSAGTDTASGTAPPGVPLGLAIGVPSGSGHPDTDPVVLGETAPADASGKWSFAAGPGTDITSSMQGFVCAIDVDGDCTGAGSGAALK